MINKKQLDEIIANSLCLMGESNNTPFNDMVFFDEDIDKDIYDKTCDKLYGFEDDFEDDFSFSDLLCVDKFNEYTSDEKEEQDDTKQSKEEKQYEKKECTEEKQSFPLDEPVIKLDPEVYKDIDVNKFDLTLNALTEETPEEVASIALLLSKLYDKHKEMLDMVLEGITDKEKYYEKHLEKSKLISKVYNTMLDRKLDDMTKTFNEFGKYVLSSKYCKNKPEVIAMIAPTIVYTRSIIIKGLDETFETFLEQANTETDEVIGLVDLIK